MNTKLTFTTLAIAAVGFALATSAPARASNGLLERCHSESSRHLVEKCCVAWIKQKGTPLWFGEGATCQNVVACAAQSSKLSITAVAVKPKCKIVMPIAADGGRSKPSEPTPPPPTGNVVGIKR